MSDDGPLFGGFWPPPERRPDLVPYQSRGWPVIVNQREAETLEEVLGALPPDIIVSGPASSARNLAVRQAAVYGRRGGKTTRTIAAIRDALARGEHVHLAGRNGLRCVDGPDDCTVTRCTFAEAEQQLRSAT